jgi:hypothetical protein
MQRQVQRNLQRQVLRTPQRQLKRMLQCGAHGALQRSLHDASRPWLPTPATGPMQGQAEQGLARRRVFPPPIRPIRRDFRHPDMIRPAPRGLREAGPGREEGRLGAVRCAGRGSQRRDVGRIRCLTEHGQADGARQRPCRASRGCGVCCTSSDRGSRWGARGSRRRRDLRRSGVIGGLAARWRIPRHEHERPVLPWGQACGDSRVTRRVNDSLNLPLDYITGKLQ